MVTKRRSVLVVFSLATTSDVTPICEVFFVFFALMGEMHDDVDGQGLCSSYGNDWYCDHSIGHIASRLYFTPLNFTLHIPVQLDSG